MSIKSEFHCVLQVSGSQKVARSFLFFPSIEFGLLRELTELHLEVRISRQLVPKHDVAVHIGQHASVQFSFLFVHDTGRNEIIQSLPKSIYTLCSCACNPGCFLPCFSLYAEIPISHVQLPKYFFLCANRFPTLSTIGIENHFGTMLTDMSKRQI